jgi:hypothetical protein
MKYFFFSLLTFLLSCTNNEPSGIMLSQNTGGPVVEFDPEAKPIPKVPLPNNVATRIDPSSSTGRRINISMQANTELEQDMRKKINSLSGFGIYSPIWVSFSKPLNTSNIIKRHSDDSNENDAVYLINITKNSPEYGKIMPLDLGRGNFPVVLEKTGEKNLYFENDPRKDSSNIIFETYNEDADKNGKLDAGEDSDMDGILDVQNTDPSDGSIVDDLLTFYEKETNTLIMRPVIPMLEETTYAVILTKRLTGTDGIPVMSPFAFVNHADQTGDLESIFEIQNLPFKTDEIAFAWEFTTGAETKDLLAIRAGLYGSGTMSYLSDLFPVDDIKLNHASDPETDNPYILKIDLIVSLFEALPDLIGDSEKEQEVFIDDLKSIDYFVLGSFKSPYFLADRDGIATEHYPADDDEIFDIDPLTGKAFFGEQYVTFICAVPKASKAGDPPFPVALVGHGYTGNRMEAFIHSGRFAKFGITTCGIDATGHGLPDLGELDPDFEGVAKLLGLTTFIESIRNGRARDLNNDGEIDSGGDYWTSDTFHTRDVVRQTLIDHMQFIRILRSFNGKNTWKYGYDGKTIGKIAGDFNGDGSVDFGGDEEKYHATGGSLGGIISGSLAGIEPAIASAAPVAGGAGLVDIGLRSSQGGVPEAVFMPLLGPFISGNPAEGGKTEIKFLVNNVNDQGHYPFYYSENIREGDIIEAENLASGEKSYALVIKSRFRLGLPADALTATERRPLLGLKDEPIKEPLTRPAPFVFGDPVKLKVIDGKTLVEKEIIDRFGVDLVFQGVKYEKDSPLEAIAKGLGLQRNSPELRRMLAIAAFIVEPGDPVVFSPHYFKYPFSYPYDTDIKAGAQVLVIPTAGDMNVPVNTGIAMARAAGIIEIQRGTDRDICFDGTDFGKTGNCTVFRGCDAVEGCKNAEECNLEQCRETEFCKNFNCCTGKMDYVPSYKKYYGMNNICLSENDILIDFHAVEGVERLRRFAFYPFCDCRKILFDADNLSDSTDGFNAPVLQKPVRSSVKTENGWQLMRIPYVEPTGTHGFGMPDPDRPFPVSNYMFNLIGYFFRTSGNPQVLHDPCFKDSTCAFFPWD